MVNEGKRKTTLENYVNFLLITQKKKKTDMLPLIYLLKLLQFGIVSSLSFVS